MQRNIENTLRNAKQAELPSSTVTKTNNVLINPEQQNITRTKAKRRNPIIVALTIIVFTIATIFAVGCTAPNSHSQYTPDNNTIESNAYETNITANETIEPNTYETNVTNEIEAYVDIITETNTTANADVVEAGGAGEAVESGITIHNISVQPDAIRFEVSIDFSRNELLDPDDDSFDFSLFLRIHAEHDFEQYEDLRVLSSHFNIDGETTISGYFYIGIIGVETSDASDDRSIDFNAIENIVLIFSGYGNNIVRIPLTI